MVESDSEIAEQREKGIYLLRTRAEEEQLIQKARGRLVGSMRLQFQRRLFYSTYSFEQREDGVLLVRGPRGTVVAMVATHERDDFEANEHCRQGFFQQLQQGPPGPMHRYTLPWQVSDIKRRLAYQSRGHTYKSVHHDGQRKLLMCEIQFLTHHYRAGRRTAVVYVGAAPGKHIVLLAEMFPGLCWALYDMRAVDAAVQWLAGVLYYDRYFGIEDAKAWAPEGWFGSQFDSVLMVSDIRESSGRKVDDAIQAAVAEDMRQQQEWVETLKPNAALLKFCLPYTDPKHGVYDGETTYLTGANVLPIWGPATTTETRLEVVPVDSTADRTAYTYARTTYSWREHEEKLYYFNTVMRSKLYPQVKSEHGPAGPYDRCFDCTAEQAVLYAYSQLSSAMALSDVVLGLDTAVSYHPFVQRKLPAHAQHQRVLQDVLESRV
jgi:hypothetical protein